MNNPIFDRLRSDEVFAAGMHASDVRSLWRNLAKTTPVQEVDDFLAGDPERIDALCAYARALVNVAHDAHYRHPEDVAVCAALVILGASPTQSARRLFADLRVNERPSLFWVRAIAVYCEEQYVQTAPNFVALPKPADVHFADAWDARLAEPGSAQEEFHLVA